MRESNVECWKISRVTTKHESLGLVWLCHAVNWHNFDRNFKEKDVCWVWDKLKLKQYISVRV